MAITAADLVLAYPEWAQVNTAFPDVVTASLAYGVNQVDEEVVGPRYEEAVFLAAGSWLYNHPYSRDMRKPNDASEDPYKKLLSKILVRKGSAWRTVWSGSDFGLT